MPIYMRQRLTENHDTIRFKKPALLVLAFLVFIVLSSFYNQPHDRTDVITLNAIRAPSANSGRNIFFVESSCVTNASRLQFEPPRGIKLDARQACAMESAARANPHANVYLLHTCPVNARRLAESSGFVREVFSYPNVFGHFVDLDTFLDDTPASVWALSLSLNESKYPVEHGSDVLRLAALWKWGGVYLDLDFIVLKSLQDLETNYAGFESDDEVANGILSFDAGHPLVERCLKDLVWNYEPLEFAANGPGLITRMLLKYCRRTGSVTNLEDLTPENCGGFTIYRPAYFFPIDYDDFDKLFDLTQNVPLEVMKIESYSYMVHIWNYLSKNMRVEKGAIQIYSVLAAKYCPMVYNNDETKF